MPLYETQILWKILNKINFSFNELTTQFMETSDDGVAVDFTNIYTRIRESCVPDD